MTGLRERGPSPSFRALVGWLSLLPLLPLCAAAEARANDAPGALGVVRSTPAGEDLVPPTTSGPPRSTGVPSGDATVPLAGTPAPGGPQPAAPAPAAAQLPAQAPAPAPSSTSIPRPYAERWVPAPDGETYVRVPPGYEAPLTLPYREGQPIPRGYRVVERSRRGLVVTGYLLNGAAYGIAAFSAMASGFTNESSWLLIPWVGPWLTLGSRDYPDCDNDVGAANTMGSDADDADNFDYSACVKDDLVIGGLIVDGIVQAAGGTLLLLGYSLTKQELVRSDYAWRVAPQRLAGGYGLGLYGSF